MMTLPFDCIGVKVGTMAGTAMIKSRAGKLRLESWAL